jgi:hypothetical protein
MKASAMMVYGVRFTVYGVRYRGKMMDLDGFVKRGRYPFGYSNESRDFGSVRCPLSGVNCIKHIKIFNHFE